MLSYDKTVAQKDMVLEIFVLEIFVSMVLEIFVSMEIKSIGLNEEKKN